MKNDLVSIVMPTYNVESIVGETISSVLNQTYQEWELLIIDDCSKDDTLSVLESYALENSKIKIHVNATNRGSGETRNRGLALAQGQYIAFLDSDDLWHVDKLKLQLEFMRINNSAISHTSFSFIDEHGEHRKGGVKVSNAVDLEGNLERTEIGTSTAMINRKLMQYEIKFSSIRARQDIKLWIDLLSQGYISHGLDKALVRYRVRKNSVSSNKVKMLYVTFWVYMKVSGLSLSKRLSCYTKYVFNAVRKRY